MVFYTITRRITGIFIVLSLISFQVSAKFTDVVASVTKGVGAIAILTPLESPNPKILGTGFVVGDGYYAITNYHVVDTPLDPTIVQNYVFLSGEGQVVKTVKATVQEIDPVHDLALLKLDAKLPALTLAKEELKKPGESVAFTGFPIGAVLGLYPATHRGYIAAITPDAIPVAGSDELSLTMMKRLGKSSLIYQLDATAYPGNSGSALYEVETGKVIGVINKVIVKDTKESALSSPTGISYAIPVKYVHALLGKTK